MAMAMLPTVPIAMGPTGPVAIVMDPKQAQEYHLRQFSLRAAAVIASNGGRLTLTAPVALASLVIEATAHPDIFDFSPLLCVPEISLLKQSQYYWVFDALAIFAYGTLKDYTRNKDILPQLNPEQLRKMRHITLLTAMEARKVIPIVDIMKEIDIHTFDELEEFLEQSAQKLGTVVRLHNGVLEVHRAPMIHGSLSSGVSLEVYFQASTVSHTDGGILSNDIVTQVRVPLNRTGSDFCWKVDFTAEGSETFIELLRLTSNGHLTRKSWNGLIYPGMLGSFRGKIFLRPGVEPYKTISDQNSLNDYVAVDNMMEKYAGLEFPHVGKSGKMEQIMYPIYVNDLRGHLQRKKTNPSVHFSGIRALDINFIMFLQCHPALLTSSAKSVLTEHIRRQYKGDPISWKKFRAKLGSFITYDTKWKRNIYNHWLFKDVFAFGLSRNFPYSGSAFDRQRYIRDWETHERENLTDVERSIFTTNALTYIVEHFLGDFLPEVLYVLVCGPPEVNLNMTIWLSKLQRTSRGH